MRWLVLLFLSSCTQVAGLNLKKHQFGLQPTKIIWFQVAGFEEEQLSMLRFQEPAERRTSFENSICIGTSWNYNLYQMRNSSFPTFLAQLTGKKNIKNSCEDAELKPIWAYLNTGGYSTGILENMPTKEQSLISLNSCPESRFLNNVYFWLRQEPPKGADTFVYSQPQAPTVNKFYYDRTCTGRTCGSTIPENFKLVAQHMSQINDKYLIIIRDFSYLEALEKKEFVRAKSILAELERAYGDALALSEKSDDYLVLLTTGDSRFVDMPDAGKGWFEYEKKGTGPQVKRTKLTNLILAAGSRAENFCGMYEDAQIFERILSNPKQQGLEFKIVNPFSL